MESGSLSSKEGLDRGPIHGSVHVGAEIDLTGRSVLNSHFQNCTLIANGPDGERRRMGNTYERCTFVGDDWAEWVQERGTWRAA